MILIRRFALSVLLLIALPVIPAEPASQPDPKMMQAVFNAGYPDLASHTDIVNAVMMALTAEGFQPKTLSGLLDTIATRARTNLQRANSASATSPETDAAAFTKRENEAREEAQRLFPDIANPGSPIYQRVMEERAKIARIYPDYFKNPEWPLMLTNGCIVMMTLEAQEKKARQQAQADQPTMSMDEAKKAIELLQMMQDLKKSRSRP